MIATADYARLMARYAAWQNENLASAADTVADPERRRDRGAFFGSIFGTMNHLLWGDRIWLSRFAGTPPPITPTIAESVDETPDWAAYRAARADQDRLAQDWAASLTDADLEGDMTWSSGATGRTVTRPFGLLVVQLFNHGTHHRGQIHALLTGAGAHPGDTDLQVMPDH